MFGKAGRNIPPDDVKFIARLFSAFIGGTPEGMQIALSLLNIRPEPVSTLQTYFKAGQGKHEGSKLRTTDLQMVRAYIWKKTNKVRWDSIEVDEREDASVCDSCGGRYPIDYCLKSMEVVKKTGESRTEMWCNRCRYQHEDPRVRQTADQRVCHGCEKVTCEFHPKHLLFDKPMALLPARAAGEPQLPAGWVRP
jgi:hypothetical protein